MTSYEARDNATQYIAETQNFGAPPEELAKLATAVASLSTLSAGQQAEIARLTSLLDTSEGILRQVLVTVAEHSGAIAPEALPGKIAELVAGRRGLLARETERTPDPDATFAGLDRDLAESIAAGDDDRTTHLLARRRDLKLTAAAHRDDAAARLRDAAARDLRDAADSEATLGNLALARLRYREAADHFRAAADLLPAADRDDRLGYHDRAADALRRQGSEFGDNAALLEAVTICRAALRARTRRRVPLDWAATQNDLGNLLTLLGEREGGTARLEEAVTAYRAALKEKPRVRVPLGWAATQSNLGNALRVLGERERGKARLEEAVAAYRAALEERTREKVPLDWAGTQNNLGNALATLGGRESGTARLEQAVVAYSAALEEWTRERVPHYWAMIQNNLGNALRALGERERCIGRLEDAIAAHHAALTQRTRERVPLDWATTQEQPWRCIRNFGASGGRRGMAKGGSCRLSVRT